ncbi:hypothetical protein SH501x_000839 [Pirellulaceae bacterium SH501]
MGVNRVPNIYLVEERIFWDGSKPLSYWGWRITSDEEVATSTFFSTRACLEEFERLVSEWMQACDNRLPALLLNKYLDRDVSFGAAVIDDGTFVVPDEVWEKVETYLEHYQHGDCRDELAND